MKDIYRQFLLGLSHDEAVEVREVLEGMIARGGEGAADECPACPRCDCRFVVRKGHDRRGAQRWLCNGCRRTFGLDTCVRAPFKRSLEEAGRSGARVGAVAAAQA